HNTHRYNSQTSRPRGMGLILLTAAPRPVMLQAASHNPATAAAGAARVLPTPSVRAAGTAVAVWNSTITQPRAAAVFWTRMGSHLFASSETRPRAAARLETAAQSPSPTLLTRAMALFSSARARRIANHPTAP